MTFRFVIIKSKYSLWLFTGTLLCVWARNSSAADTQLALRSGCAMPIYGGITVQTLNTNFGTNLSALAFAGTSTYDFYSPPLGASVALMTSDKGGGVVYMRNTGTTSATDISVTGRMQYFDYNPNTGTGVPIVDTGASTAQNVNHGQTVNWAIPNVLLSSNITIPAGHMIHVAMTIGLVSGNPGSSGQVLYNGSNAPSTMALFPQNRSAVLGWSFNSSVIYGAAAKIVSIAQQPDSTMLISCAGKASTTYSIQASASLQSAVWTTIAATNSDSNGLFSIIDPDAAGYPCCFYRTVTTAP